MFRYCLTIWLGATLLFLVQPMVGRLMLPTFGGLAIVWTTSVVVFQVLLLAGYLWAHLLHRLFSPRVGLIVHLLAVVASAFFLPPTAPDAAGLELAGSIPLQVSWMVVQAIGPSFWILAATSPLVQAWQAETHAEKNPFRLYALSNFGSLLGLIGYPLLIEPSLAMQAQTRWWSVGYVIYAVCLLWSGSQVGKLSAWRVREVDPFQAMAAISWRTIGVWILLPAISSALMLSVTTVLGQEVASFPFLWVLPLAAYLISWIVAFDRPSWYRRRPVYLLLVVLGAAGLLLLILGTDATIGLHMLIMTGLCFAGCWLCHGELERAKPEPRLLTLFWTLTSLGSLVGGVLVVVGAPRMLNGFYEFHLSLAATVMVGYAVVVAGAGQKERPRFGWQSGLWSLLGLLLLALLGASFFQTDAIARQQGMIYQSRGDYGLMSVWEQPDFRYIQSGQTMHGRQLSDPARRFEPIDYYAPDRAVGLAVESLRADKAVMAASVHSANTESSAGQPERPRQSDQGLRIGVIGLGSGCLTAWARAGDRIRFYELNPEVEKIAWKWFEWLPEARRTGTLEEPVVLGDARVQLSRERAEGKLQQLDLLVVDAFTSDSIPSHLLTQECFQLYRSHLRPGGILAIHITNRNIDLRPVMLGSVAASGGQREALLFEYSSSEANPYGCTWVLIGDRDQLQRSGLTGKATPWPDGLQSVVWTDEFNSVMGLVDWRVGINLDSLARRKKLAGRARQNQQ